MEQARKKVLGTTTDGRCLLFLFAGSLFGRSLAAFTQPPELFGSSFLEREGKSRKDLYRERERERVVSVGRMHPHTADQRQLLTV